MANDEHLEILKKGVEAWNRWREEHRSEHPDLSGADLSDAYLTGADLTSANLTLASLRGVDLTGADLTFANLNGTDLSGADLSDANLRGAILREANLHEATFHIATMLSWMDENISGTVGSFLDLATCVGLTEARFSHPWFLPNYLERAFGFAHRTDTREAKVGPRFVAYALEKVKALRALYPDNTPPDSLVEAVQTITAQLIQYLAKHPKAMYTIEPRQFEELIAEILASYGWQVHLTKATRDGGYDLFAISKDQAGVETSWIIECKKYREDRKVGIDVARALYGVKMDLNVANMMLATTSHFSRDLHAWKASRYDLELRDYEGILEWLNEYRPNPSGQLYIKDNRLVVPGEEE